MNKFIFLLSVLMVPLSGWGQKYLTQTGNIRFFSEAPLENIESINNQVSSVIDMETGAVAFSLLMKAFNFEKALMQEHFNEKYIESETYPKSTFKGSIVNYADLEIGTEATEVMVDGSLTIHGVTQEVSIPATLQYAEEGKLTGSAVFQVEVADYEIKIPAAVKDNIAKTIEITVNAEYEKMD